LTLSHALKNYSTETVEQSPAAVFTEMFYETNGIFYGKEAESEVIVKNIAPTEGQASEDGGESVANCAISYSARHDQSVKLHAYCFAADRSPCVKISCKGLEYLLKNPHIAFYDTVLGLQIMPWRSKGDGRRLLIGSLTHEFLQIFEAGNQFVAKASADVFHENINSRARRLKASVNQACAAADAEVPPRFDAAVNEAAIAAKRLVGRLFAMDNWKSFSSEFSIPKHLPIDANGCEIKLSGRLDFLLSGEGKKEGNHLSSNVVIVDFKTGNDPELTERNIRWHMQKFSGVQLLLYGMALRAIGFKHIKILVLKPDSGPSNGAIDLEYAIGQASPLMEKLGQMARTGLIERQILGKNYRQFFIGSVPLATTDLY
jgi:hypothetical protein